MNTLLNQGKSIEIVAGGTIASGTPVKTGSLVGIASNSYVSGDTAVIWLTGTHLVPKATGAAWAQGAQLYWDATASNFTTTSTSNQFAGYAAIAALSADATGYILLRQ